MSQTHNELREEFEQWKEKTRNPIGDGFPVTNSQIADWWLSKLDITLQAELEGLREEIKKEQKVTQKTEWEDGYQSALSDMDALLTSRLEKLQGKQEKV